MMKKSGWMRGKLIVLALVLGFSVFLCSILFAADARQAVSQENKNALEELGKKIETNPVDPVLYFNRARALSDAGQPEKAIEDYDKAIELDPRYAAAYTNLANLLIPLGFYDEAIEDLNRSIELDPGDPNAFFNRATAYANRGDDAQALADYEKTLRMSPKNSDAYGNRGFFLERRGQPDRAIADYTKAIELAPTVSRHYNNRGHAWFIKGDYDRALADMGKAIELQPDNAKAYRNRAEVWLASGDYQKSLLDISRSIELSAEDSKAFWIRYRVFAAMGAAAAAKADEERALSLGPQPGLGSTFPVPPEIVAREKLAMKEMRANDNPQNRAKLAQARHDHAFAILNDPGTAANKEALEQAVGYSQSAEALEPEAAEHPFLTALLFRELAKSDQRALTMAEKALRQTLDLDPEHAPASLELGLMMLEQERGREAMMAFEDALLNDPMKTAAVAVGPLTATYAIHDEGDRGLDFFRELCAANPEVSALGIGLAIMLDHQGDRAAALEQVRDLMLVEEPGTLVHDYAEKLASEWGGAKS
jgi:tetratricopeptide (TPR) repeat protein